ncbi:transposase [Rhodococcus globerulus]|jgi:hypothetical protein|nr:transposase [Rhodococcus globerulus]
MLKYSHDFPKSFASLEDAQVFLEGFFNEYNHIHRHSGIAWHTPTSVHFGTADAVDEARQTRHGFRADRVRPRCRPPYCTYTTLSGPATRSNLNCDVPSGDGASESRQLHTQARVH